jgi:malonate-semialdehyde dehydrogenase (acetylating)/methylmalonate-semialdehyde dehydrogenase
MKNLKTGNGLDNGVDLGPITTPQSLERIHRLIGTVEKEGGKVLVDGRNLKMPSPYDKGNFIGPSILTDLSTDMTAYKEEIFGPVMCVLRVNNLDEAINLINR